MKSLLLKVFLSVFSAAFLLASAHAAVTCLMIDESNNLYKFTSSNPAAATSTAVSGLPMGYRLVGLDFRTTVRTNGAANPGVGSLWALATDGSVLKLYSINPATAAASFIGNLSGIVTTGSDNGWFFGFDPATDTLRIMNFIDNYSVNPNTLAVTADTKFNAPGVTNPDHFPALNGSAYSTASFGGTSQIYFLDQGNDGLNTSADISTGDFSAFPMPMNVGFSSPAGLDVDGATMLMCAFDTVTSQARLFSVNRTNGTFASLGTVSASPGSLVPRALAIQPVSFPPKLAVTAKISGPKKVVTANSSRLIKGTAKSQAGIKFVEYKIGKAKFKKAKGTKKWKFTAKLKPGKNVISVRATGGNGVKSKIAKVTITRE